MSQRLFCITWNFRLVECKKKIVFLFVFAEMAYANMTVMNWFEFNSALNFFLNVVSAETLENFKYS